MKSDKNNQPFRSLKLFLFFKRVSLEHITYLFNLLGCPHTYSNLIKKFFENTLILGIFIQNSR